MTLTAIPAAKAGNQTALGRGRERGEGGSSSNIHLDTTVSADPKEGTGTQTTS